MQGKRRKHETAKLATKRHKNLSLNQSIKVTGLPKMVVFNSDFGLPRID
jgi:hypothetical protein